MLQTREMSEWVVHNILRTPFYAEGITPTRETRVRMKIISPAIKTFYMTHVKTKRPSLSLPSDSTSVLKTACKMFDA